jgi:hypothetical protein
MSKFIPDSERLKLMEIAYKCEALRNDIDIQRAVEKVAQISKRHARRQRRLLNGVKTAILFFAFIASSCAQDEPQPIAITHTVTYNVTALTGQCVAPGLMAGAIVDKGDKLDLWVPFDCQTASNSVILAPGDSLQIKVASNSAFDKTLRYHITVTQDGESEDFPRVDYKGVQYVVK